MSEKIIIIQPQKTLGKKLRNIKSLESSKFDEIIRSLIFKNQICHLGTAIGSPDNYIFHNCGHPLRISFIRAKKAIALRCESLDRGTEVILKQFDRKIFAHLIIDLILHQFVPDLNPHRIINFEDQVNKNKQRQKIFERIGLVSFLKSEKIADPSQVIAFTLAPGLDTTRGLDGLDIFFQEFIFYRENIRRRGLLK